MAVDVASPRGGVIPVDPLSLNPFVRTSYDDRFLADEALRGKVTASLPIDQVDVLAYDVVHLAGGWGAAFLRGHPDGRRHPRRGRADPPGCR